MPEPDFNDVTISSFDPAFVDLTRPSGGPSTRPSIGRSSIPVTNLSSNYVSQNNGGFVAQTLDAGQGLFNAINDFNPVGVFLDEALHGMSSESEATKIELANTVPSGIWNNMSEEEKNQMARDTVQDRNAAPNTKTETDAFGQYTGGTGTVGAGGAGSGSGGTGGTVGEGQGDPVSRLSEARQPRGLTFSNLFGSTRFDPETGEFIQMDDDQFKQFQTGLLGQLTSAQEAFQSFNPQDAASEYLRGVNAIREPLREQQTQSALSRLIQSGRLGASSGTRALAQLEREQESQRFTEGVQATQFGQEQQQQLMANQAGLFGLAQNVAQQQFGGQQSALGAVPLLQEIYSFPEEPAFQRDLAQMVIDAQKSATNTGLFGDIFGMVAPKLFGL
jgi:hypothetical protein